MGSVRVCGARCHKARQEECSCWCGGLFHGAGGADARAEFQEIFGRAVPASEKEYEAVTSQPCLVEAPA